MVAAGAAAQVCEERTQEGAQHLTRESGIPGAAVTQGIRQRENPLPHGDFWEYAVDEMSGGVCHAASTARRAEPPTAAREGEQAVVAAAVAVQAQEAVGQHSAFEVGAQLSLYEARHRRAPLACAREEALEMFSDDFVEQRLLGLAAFVLDGAGPARGRVQAESQQVWCRLSGALPSPSG
jgi:hypothetical protein